MFKFYYINALTGVILMFIGIFGQNPTTVAVGIFNIIVYYGERILDEKSIQVHN